MPPDRLMTLYMMVIVRRRLYGTMVRCLLTMKVTLLLILYCGLLCRHHVLNIPVMMLKLYLFGLVSRVRVVVLLLVITLLLLA